MTIPNGKYGKMSANFLETYRNKKVLITGNTGFKGGWLSQWLLQLNAGITGYALEPPTSPALFNYLKLNKNTNAIIGDIRNFEKLKKTIKQTKPDIIFHLAAQSIVRESYTNPVDTLETNINGTINLLEAVRQLKLSTAIIIVTSDKCYDNKEWIYGYREIDPMGGYDPYSVSKGATELIVSAWRNSFFNPKKYQYHGVKVSSVRAGNVIGGGDWSADRIIPDCVRSLEKDEVILIRNPKATRPWQHVLEPLGGYLLLGSKLLNEKESTFTYETAFNFGPQADNNKTVGELVNTFLKYWGKGSWQHIKSNDLHEASLLSLNIEKAYHLLDWKPLLNFEHTIEQTANWYKEYKNNKENSLKFTEGQINKYITDITF